MKVLVAGGAGFVGSYLVESLVELGHEVDIIDDLSTGNIENLRGVGKNSKLNIHFDRIENSPLLQECMLHADFVYYLVPNHNDKVMKEDPALFIRKVMHKAQTVLDHAATQKVPTLIAVSQNCDLPSTEKVSHHDEGMARFESLAEAAANAIYEYAAMAYCAKRKQPIAIARLANVASPRQVNGLGRIVKNYLEQIMQGNDISIPADGMNSWQFTEVGDVVSGLTGILKSGIPVTGAVHHPAMPVHTTTRELIECALKLTGSLSSIQYLPAEIENYPGGRSKSHTQAANTNRLPMERLIRATMEHIRRNAQTWEEFQIAS
jgi:UDP-glucose 4-epimerase